MHIIDGMTVGYSADPLFIRGVLALQFDEHVNVFIGTNGCGKSTLLRSLAERAPGFVDTHFTTHGELYIGAGWDPRRVYQNLLRHNLTENDVRRLDDWEQPGHDSRWELRMFPWTFLPATRIPVPALGDTFVRDNPKLVGVDARIDYDELASAILSFIENGNPFDNGVWLPLDNLFVFNATIMENLIKAMFNNFPGAYLVDMLIDMERVAANCARKIASGIIVGQPGHYASIPDGIFVEEQSVHPGMGLIVKAGANSDEHLEYVGHLSAGTQGVYLWVLYIALKIALHYKFESGWEKRPAILLIDEIENHLHPTWQRRVIPALLDQFPGLQIFATTHSPFVVAGLKAGQVHLLNRDENGVVSATTNQQDIIGWTADEILRVYMGVGEPTDERTANAGAELRRLRDMGTLADEREEEQRQARIRELREIVNIAVLDGPRAAEDARFKADLIAILERYRQSQDLNQENG